VRPRPRRAAAAAQRPLCPIWTVRGADVESAATPVAVLPPRVVIGLRLPSGAPHTRREPRGPALVLAVSFAVGLRPDSQAETCSSAGGAAAGRACAGLGLRWPGLRWVGNAAGLGMRLGRVAAGVAAWVAVRPTAHCRTVLLGLCAVMSRPAGGRGRAERRGVPRVWRRCCLTDLEVVPGDQGRGAPAQPRDRRWAHRDRPGRELADPATVSYADGQRDGRGWDRALPGRAASPISRSDRPARRGAPAQPRDRRGSGAAGIGRAANWPAGSVIGLGVQGWSRRGRTATPTCAADPVRRRPGVARRAAVGWVAVP